MVTTEVVDADLLDSLDRFFRETVDHELITAAEGTELLEDLWARCDGMDLLGIGIDPDRGGAGGGLPQLVALMQAAGRHAVPLPLLEHHLATWLLVSAGATVPDGLSTVAPGTAADEAHLSGTDLHGCFHQVAWTGAARRVVAIVPDETGVLCTVAAGRESLTVEPGTDLAGQPRDVVRAQGMPCQVLARGVDRTEMQRRAVLLRAAQMTGAMEAVAGRTLAYVRERQQFGAAIGSFQSVQQHVVTVQQVATMTALCVGRAVSALGTGGGSFEVAALRVIASDNAATAVRSAHQAHGAIGMTREFGLQTLTRRLNTWRWDFGAPSDAAREIGALVTDAEKLSAVITAEPGSQNIAYPRGELTKGNR